ncbi:cytochrome P450 [Nonomuraea sp. SMC257]|uniref:Cytochrome P450 n=1 Tax=Nonomuraea montanisoli TaxID=2741721 RepID=A0A7Y6I6Q9_9ACTN|nr:cytochrome P450 [Nonomuraea montanisoli]NUW32697.1 cytochrome P450 [Nonomuraea montanisoli]
MIPPGPRLPAAAQTAWFMADPVGFFESCHRRYGPVFTARYVGFPPEVYVATGELAEQVYRTDLGGGRAGEARRDFLEPLVGAHSVLTLDGDPWWAHRKLLTPPLRARQVAGYHDEITEIAAERIAAWPLGRPFTLRERMQDITLEVILRLIFGIRDAARLTRLRRLLPGLLHAGSAMTVAMAPPGLRSVLGRVPFAPYRRFLRLKADVDAILYDEIARRRAAPGGTDVLGRLLETELGDEEIRDELITMLLAGHETTATGLAWAFERLLRLPAVLERLPDDEEYLDAVVREVLRVRPVVYEAPRLLDAPLRLGEHEVPAGWYAGPSIPLVHHDPAVWDEPQEFRPERFLGGQQHTRSWMPFGGGRRFCVGAQLALLEMRVIIREVLRRLDLSVTDPAPEARRLKNVTLAPARRTRVVARARVRARAA